jgi:hypothetical protein
MIIFWTFVPYFLCCIFEFLLNALKLSKRLIKQMQKVQEHLGLRFSSYKMFSHEVSETLYEPFILKKNDWAMLAYTILYNWLFQGFSCSIMIPWVSIATRSISERRHNATTMPFVPIQSQYSKPEYLCVWNFLTGTKKSSVTVDQENFYFRSFYPWLVVPRLKHYP